MSQAQLAQLSPRPSPPPWDRLTDVTYKSWLLEAMTVEEYNASTPRDRRLLLSDFEQRQQQQQQASPDPGYPFHGSMYTQQRQVAWYQVKGIIKRNKHVAGVRFKLISLAKDGYYPAGMSVSEAFKVERTETESEDLLNHVSVVFEEKREARRCITEVDSYVTKTRGISIREGFGCTEIRPFNRPTLVLESHYVPRKSEGEDNTPNSPPWDVVIDAVSIFSAPSRYSKGDTVYKYQRIEVDHGVHQKEHIFFQKQSVRESMNGSISSISIVWLCRWMAMRSSTVPREAGEFHLKRALEWLYNQMDQTTLGRMVKISRELQ